MDPDDLEKKAQATLRGNDAGTYTKPGPSQYPHQWNWDSAVIALGLAHFDLPRALTEIRALLSGQWRDGMLPHIVYHQVPSDYFPDPGFWQIENSPSAPTRPTSGITQPPLLATVIRKIHTRTPIPEFIRESFPALLKWHRWLHTARDPDRTGAAACIHPWESGTDDSPRWLKAMEDITPTGVPAFHRGDTRYVPASERPFQADYERFIHLIDVFRQHRYEPAALYSKSPFLVQDVLFNSILHRADEDLLWLAGEIRQPAVEILDWLKAMRRSFTQRFWDDSLGLYFDYNLRKDAPIPVNSATTFMPLFGGLASPDQAKRLIAEHWQNPAEYALSDSLRYRIPSTSRAETHWEARRYWRGPVWIILNWMLFEGLRRYGFYGLAAELRRDSLELAEHSGFREYYDPRDGSGCGSTDFSWSAALTIEMLNS